MRLKVKKEAWVSKRSLRTGPSSMGHDGSPEAITEGRKWNYARLPVGLSWQRSAGVTHGSVAAQ